MNPGFVTEILVICSFEILFSSPTILFAISIGDFFRSFESSKAIFEQRSPNSVFFGGVKEHSFFG